MRDLPEGWRWATLGDLAADTPRSITDGPFGSNLARSHYTSHGPQVVRLQNIGDGHYIDSPAHISEDHYISLIKHDVIAGDLLVASLGETLPRACLAPETLGPAIVKADCIRIRLSEGMESKWVLYALQTPDVRRWADDQRHGVGRPRLGLKGVRLLPIPLAPRDEQQRIVAILEDHLSRLDAAAGYLRAGRTRLQRLTDGLLANEYASPVGSPTAALPAVEGVDDSALPSIPPTWSWRRLGDVADVVGGVTKDAKRQGDPSFIDVPYLRVANVQRGRLDLSTVTTIKVPPATADSLRLRRGDVLLNEGGDRDKLGRGWVWDEQIDLCIHQNHVFRARVRDDALLPELLSHAANTIGGRWCQVNGTQSVNLASISLRKIRLMPVPVPPREEQRAMASRIAEGRASCARLGLALATAEREQAALRRALLAAAFSGRLTGRTSDLDLAEEFAATDAPA